LNIIQKEVNTEGRRLTQEAFTNVIESNFYLKSELRQLYGEITDNDIQFKNKSSNNLIVSKTGKNNLLRRRFEEE
jgi:hypothetical protein